MARDQEFQSRPTRRGQEAPAGASAPPASTITGANALTNAVNDAAAATAGVAIGSLYRNGSVIMVRIA